MKKIYFESIDGDIFEGYEIVNAALITEGKKIPYDDPEAICAYAKTCKFIRGVVEAPSVEDMVKKGYTVKAARLYRNTHPGVTLSQAYDAVIAMREQLRAAE